MVKQVKKWKRVPSGHWSASERNVNGRNELWVQCSECGKSRPAFFPMDYVCSGQEWGLFRDGNHYCSNCGAYMDSDRDRGLLLRCESTDIPGVDRMFVVGRGNLPLYNIEVKEDAGLTYGYKEVNKDEH